MEAPGVPSGPPGGSGGGGCDAGPAGGTPGSVLNRGGVDDPPEERDPAAEGGLSGASPSPLAADLYLR